jgi:ubiquinone/menaquinone biosynthesis C-methylase UbiE
VLKSNRTISRTAIDDLDLGSRVQLEAKITDDRSQAIAFEQFKQLDTGWASFTEGRGWRRCVADFFGPLEGKTLLDVACGYSMTPVIFALAGATVHAIDVAPKTIAMVQQFAEYKGVGDRVKAHVGPAEELPFPDATFDLVFGGAALHHLQLERAAREIARVLKPGGRGAFQEPLGHNRLLEFARDYLPYKNKHPVKGTDRPLYMEDVARFGACFANWNCQGFDLLGMAGKVFGLPRDSAVRRVLYQADAFLFANVPFVQRYARYAVISVTK